VHTGSVELPSELVVTGQKATNSSMTQAAMETVCKNEANKHQDKDGNDLATAPQAPKPQD
jgi:hypothetical protein